MTANFFHLDDQDISLLQKQWNDLTTLFSSNPDLIDKSFQELQERYSENRRVYHNLSHIKALLNLFESLKHQLEDQEAIRFAIWFHDAVYDTRRSDNEEKSADLAVEMLGRLSVNIETIGSVRELIRATKEHSGSNLSADAKLFLDMDLAILGSTAEIYRHYSKAIREEYSWVPSLMYRRSRKKVLQSFIEREKIYHTEELRRKFELQARMNMQGEIESL